MSVNSIEKRDFDKEAAVWDEKPARLKLAKEIADAISKAVILKPDMDIIDFGCGTGLLTVEIYNLQPLVRSIIGIDSSKGMLDILNTKISKLNLTNVKTMLVDIDQGDAIKAVCEKRGCKTSGYNLVTSSMTLHHIKEIKPLLEQFYQIIGEGGHLCIADLDPDDGRFHENNTGVFHFGFNRDELRQTFVDAGFKNVKDDLAAKVAKPDQNGVIREFDVFLITGEKI